MSGELRIERARALAPLLGQARYKGAYGGRGSGKSWFFADLLIKRMVKDRATRAVCIREVQNTLDDSVKSLLESRIKFLGVDSLFRVLRDSIETTEGGVVLFRGMSKTTADSLKSLEGMDIAWVEEAQTLSKRSLVVLDPTIRKEGSEIWFSWNPRYQTDPVDKFFRDPKHPLEDAILVKALYTDNPWANSTIYKIAERDRSRDVEQFGHVWLGEYEHHSEARVFRNWTVRDFETASDAQFYMGADWGFSIDPTVLIRCYISGRTIFIDREAYEIGCEIDRTPALFDALDPERHGMARQWPIVADSARPETISYMQRHGFPRIQAARKGPGSVEEGISFLQSYDIVAHPRCENTIRELTSYSYERDRLDPDRILPKLEDTRNHVIDALRYALESVRLRTGGAFMNIPGL